MLIRISLLILFVTVAGPLSARDPCEEAEGYLSAGDLRQAADRLEDCIRFRPDALAAYLRLCAVYQQLGDSDKLGAVARQGLERFPGEHRFYLTAGIHAGRSGDFNQAIDVLSRALRLWPQDASLRHNLVQAYLSRGMERLDSQDSQEAAADLRAALELDPQNVEGLLNLGRALHNLHQREAALETILKVQALDPDLPGLAFHLGLVNYALGDYEAAIRALDLQIERDPNFPSAFYIRGLCWQYKGNWERAAADLSRACELMPLNGEAYLEKGRSLIHLGRRHEAEAALRRAVGLNESNARALYTLGQLLVREGRTGEARGLLERAARLNDENRTAQPGEIRFSSTRKPQSQL